MRAQNKTSRTRYVGYTILVITLMGFSALFGAMLQKSYGVNADLTTNLRVGTASEVKSCPPVPKIEPCPPPPLHVPAPVQVAAIDDSRKKLSAAFNKMSSRSELPNLITTLGLLNEGVEVGVRAGEFSKWILGHCSVAMMHMVDPWELQDKKLYHDISNRDQKHQDKLYNNLNDYMDTPHRGRYQLHRGYSVEKAKDFKDNSLDFVYLDARHDYAGVKEDLEAWWPKLKQGGLFAGHDFVPDGNLKEGAFGVQKAVWEFCSLKHKEYLSISSKMPHGGRQEPQHVDGGWTSWYFIK